MDFLVTKQSRYFQVGYECVSLAWHPSGGALAAGSTEGHLVVLNADAGAHVATLRVCGSPLSCLAYNSGKETMLANYDELT